MAMLEKYIPQRISKGFDGEELESPCEGDAPCHHRHCFLQRRASGLQPGVVELTVALGLAFSCPWTPSSGMWATKATPTSCSPAGTGSSTPSAPRAAWLSPAGSESPYDLFTCGYSSTPLSPRHWAS